MSSFTEGLQVELLPDGKTFELLRPFHYYFYEGVSEGVTIPAGFQTDFATVPAIVSPFIQKMGKHSKASVLHDYLYTVPQFRTRLECDQIFRDAMKVSGVSMAKRNAIYYAVRMFGASHFKGIQ